MMTTTNSKGKSRRKLLKLMMRKSIEDKNKLSSELFKMRVREISAFIRASSMAIKKSGKFRTQGKAERTRGKP